MSTGSTGLPKWQLAILIGAPVALGIGYLYWRKSAESEGACSSYPEGNFGGNQLLDGSIGLSPLCPILTIDLHVRTASVLHQGFP